MSAYDHHIVPSCDEESANRHLGGGSIDACKGDYETVSFIAITCELSGVFLAESPDICSKWLTSRNFKLIGYCNHVSFTGGGFSSNLKHIEAACLTGCTSHADKYFVNLSNLTPQRRSCLIASDTSYLAVGAKNHVLRTSQDNNCGPEHRVLLVKKYEKENDQVSKRVRLGVLEQLF